VIVGERDPLVQVESLHKVADDMGASFTSVSEAGHLLAVEAPGLLAATASPSAAEN
jgi:predicted alpha/beta hydrolase family esterase